MTGFAPAYNVRIDGKSFSDKVTRLVYEDCADKDDKLEIALEGGIDLADDPALQEGKTISAQWGYAGNMSPTKNCAIDSIEPAFGETATITLTALDKGSAMKSAEVQRIWKNKKYSEIAAEIAGKYGLIPDVEDSGEIVVNEPQSNITDFAFLQKLSVKIGFHFWIDGKKLYFKSSGRAIKEVPILSVEYAGAKGIVKRFAPVSNKEKEAGSTVVKSFDQKLKKKVEHKAGENTDRVRLGKKSVFVNAESLAEKIKIIPLPTNPQNSPAEEKKLAESKKVARELENIKAELEMEGNPAIAAKKVITVSGVGKKFSGNYFISAARHMVDNSGYLLQLDLKRNAVGESGTVIKKNSAAAGGNEKTNLTKGPEKAKKRTVTVDPVSRQER